MPRLRSRIPHVQNIETNFFRYLEGLDRRIAARDDLAASPTATEIATAINQLYSDLRDAGIMERG